MAQQNQENYCSWIINTGLNYGHEMDDFVVD